MRGSMKARIAGSVVMGVIALMIFFGCASAAKKVDSRKGVFLQQLAESRPVKEYGYSIRDVRFSKDGQKVLVVFNHPESNRPPWEFVLADDGFGRYRGNSMQPFYTPGTAHTPSVSITVTPP